MPRLTIAGWAEGAAIPAAGTPAEPGSGAPNDGAAPLAALARLDEIPGIGVRAAQTIIAEVGLNMAQFPTAGQLVSWAKLSPRTIQSGPRSRSGQTGKGNPYFKGVLGDAAAAAAKTDTFLGERYRRLIRRRGKLKALVAVARSILVVVWHLLADPASAHPDGQGCSGSSTVTADAGTICETSIPTQAG